MSGPTRRRRVRHDLKTAHWQRIREAILERDGGWCQACGRCPPEVSRLVVDHRTPPERGGEPYDPANLWTLCVACNTSKGRLTVEEWAAFGTVNEPAPGVDHGPRPVTFRDRGWGR